MNTNDYNLSISDKKEIIKHFIDFKEFCVIESIKHSPDKRFTLLLIDKKNYVFVETDYFNNEENYESREIERVFGLKLKKWLTVKDDLTRKSYDGIAAFSSKAKDNTVYSLALVED